MRVLIIEDDPLHRSYLHEAVRAALPECDTVLEAETAMPVRCRRANRGPSMWSWTCR